MGQSHPFYDPGGWRLRGLGQAPTVCLNQQQNAISCDDPGCAIGHCGTQVGPVPTFGCLNQAEDTVLCTDPECTYGDCGPSLAPGPGPRVTVPVTLAPGTSPIAGKTFLQCAAAGLTRNAAGQCVASTGGGLMSSTIVAGIPDVVLYGAGFLLAATMLMGGGGKRR